MGLKVGDRFIVNDNDAFEGTWEVVHDKVYDDKILCKSKMCTYQLVDFVDEDISILQVEKKPMTRQEAIAMAGSAWWVDKTPVEIVRFQINEDTLCMPFSLFHKAVEQVVGEPVYIHQFAFKPFTDRVKKLVEEGCHYD